jgi:hypothetical protein
MYRQQLDYALRLRPLKKRSTTIIMKLPIKRPNQTTINPINETDKSSFYFVQRFRCTTFCGRRLTTKLCEAFLSKSAECVQIFLYSKKIWTEERAEGERRSGVPGVIWSPFSMSEPRAREGERATALVGKVDIFLLKKIQLK